MSYLKKIYTEQMNIEERKEKTIIKLNNETKGEMVFFKIMPGIYLLYNKFNSKQLTVSAKDKSFMEIIEINYCKLGRYGSIVNSDKQIYLGEGEISASIAGIKKKDSEFPLGFYYGLEIIINVKESENYLKSFFPEINRKIKDLYSYLLNNEYLALITKMPKVLQLFNELYEMEEKINIEYVRLKILEIILLLQIVPFDNIRKNQYFSKVYIDKVKEIQKYAVNNLEKKITLNELSEKYDISLTNLKNCFKEVYGSPYYTYIKKYKIHKAAHYLEETKMSISEIALKLGYENISKFISAFKGITGYTPGEYRKKNVLLEHLNQFGVEIN